MPPRMPGEISPPAAHIDAWLGWLGFNSHSLDYVYQGAKIPGAVTLYYWLFSFIFAFVYVFVSAYWPKIRLGYGAFYGFIHHSGHAWVFDSPAWFQKGSVANRFITWIGLCAFVGFRRCGIFKGRHFDQSVILLCVRWYLAYNLSLRDLEEMLAERGLSVDHSTVHRWIIHFSPMLLESFNRRKRAVTGKWCVDETYIKVRGQWMYLYRAIDSVGDTVEFFFSKSRDLPAAKRFFKRALERHGRPDCVVIDGSQTNREAIVSCDATNRLQDRSRRQLKPITIRSSKYLNNRIEQDHRRIKRRVRSMLGFKSEATAATILAGIEMIHMMRKRQARYAYNPSPSIAEQFTILAA